VLDKPFAELNPRVCRALINLLRELSIMMLMFMYDMKLIEDLFPRMIVMDEVVIVADAKLLEAMG
jgi:energy-coupling factor transporter ATP-binding protein EcfA2